MDDPSRDFSAPPYKRPEEKPFEPLDHPLLWEEHKLRATGPATPVDADDQLGLTIIGNGTVLTLSILYRILEPDGIIHRYVFTKVVTASGAQPFFFFPLTKGLLLGVLVANSTAGAQTPRGLVYAYLFLARKDASAPNATMLLDQGYITTLGQLHWPYGLNEQAARDYGFLAFNTAANPAAGAEVQIAWGAFPRVIIRSVRFRLVTSAAVANRQVNLTLKNLSFATLSLQLWPAPAVQVASTTIDYSFFPGAAFSSAVAGQQTAPMPPDLRPPGQSPSAYALVTVTTNLQAGDQYSNLEAQLETFAND